MSASSDAPPTEHAERRLPAQALPPVEAPTGTFILQLFLIPLLIVTIVVLMWLLFSWIAHMGRDNAADLVKAVERGDNWSGQRAYELADLLRSSDSRYDAVRRDADLAQRLADFLQRDLAEPVTRKDWRRVMRRMYLCRALGSFEVQDGLPVLLMAAKQERDPVEVEVRFSAVEAIAALADNCGPESFQQNPQLVELLLETSRATDDGSAPPPPNASDGTPTLYRPHAELRAVAAYALGVIGGEQAHERLRRMLHDVYPNARYNAATGLARAGDQECEPVLKEMLDPEGTAAVADERHEIDRARKRTTVLMNGIKATLLLAENNPSADLSQLKASLHMLAKSPLPNVAIDRTKVQGTALEALRLLEAKIPTRRS